MQVGTWRFGETALIGLVVAVQGFGSALAEGVWGVNWGLLALAERWTPVPAWAGVVVGVLGLVVVALGARRTTARR
jgi:hypothetical protein